MKGEGEFVFISVVRGVVRCVRGWVMGWLGLYEVWF